MELCDQNNNFFKWLSTKLKELNKDVDLNIFVFYIHGILDTETDYNDRVDSICGILNEIIIESGIKTEDHCNEIIAKWCEYLEDQHKENDQESKIDIKIHDIIASQTAESSKIKSLQQNLNNDINRKAAILANYAEISDGDITDEDDEKEDSKSKINQKVQTNGINTICVDLLTKNTNALAIKERERVERGKAKQESEEKKQKDKENRETQKKKIQDRKDDEKKRTQKGEKRR